MVVYNWEVNPNYVEGEPKWKKTAVICPKCSKPVRRGREQQHERSLCNSKKTGIKFSGNLKAKEVSQGLTLCRVNTSGAPTVVHVNLANNFCQSCSKQAQLANNPNSTCPHRAASVIPLEREDYEFNIGLARQTLYFPDHIKTKLEEVKKLCDESNEAVAVVCPYNKINGQYDRLSIASVRDTSQGLAVERLDRTVVEVLKKTESACPQKPLVRCRACTNIKSVNGPKCWHGWAALVKLNSGLPTANSSDDDQEEDDDDRTTAPAHVVREISKSAAFLLKYKSKIDPKMVIKRSAYKKPKKSLTLTCSNQQCVRCKGHLQNQTPVEKRYVTEWGLEDGCVVHCVSKKCTDCGKVHPFFYDTKSMLFFAGKVVISMSLLTSLRSHMEQAHSFSSALKAIQTQYLGKDVQELYRFKRYIQNAFFAFLCLLDTDNDLHCVVCGYDPPILIGDVCEKICHNHPLDITSADHAEHYYSDPDKSWMRIEIYQISLVLYSDTQFKAPKFEVSPSNWPPLCSKKLRREDGLMKNSEPEKARSKAHIVHIVEQARVGGEGDLNAIREELMTLLSEEAKRDELKDMCLELGIAGTAGDNVHDLRQKLKDWMFEHNLCEENVFIKQFLKTVKSKSGGVLYVVCPHNVVYYMKLLMRAEGRRDYLDFLVSIKQVPHLFIYDFVTGLRDHMVSSLFNEHSQWTGHRDLNAVEFNIRGTDGALYPDEERYRILADNNTLPLVSIPALNMCQPLERPPRNEVRELTLACDNLHIANIGDRFQSQRHSVRNIKEFRENQNMLNTIAAEQVNNTTGPFKAFVNKMSAPRHAIAMRHVVSTINDNANIRSFQQVENQAVEYYTRGTNKGLPMGLVKESPDTGKLEYRRLAYPRR